MCTVQCYFLDYNYGLCLCVCSSHINVDDVLYCNMPVLEAYLSMYIDFDDALEHVCTCVCWALLRQCPRLAISLTRVQPSALTVDGNPALHGNLKAKQTDRLSHQRIRIVINGIRLDYITVWEL